MSIFVVIDGIVLQNPKCEYMLIEKSEVDKEISKCIQRLNCLKLPNCNKIDIENKDGNYESQMTYEAIITIIDIQRTIKYEILPNGKFKYFNYN